MSKRDVDYEDRLLEDLRDPVMFLLALRQAARAQGMTALVREYRKAPMGG